MSHKYKNTKKVGTLGSRPSQHHTRIKNIALRAYFLFWWVMRGSNPRPSRCKRDALAN